MNKKKKTMKIKLSYIMRVLFIVNFKMKVRPTGHVHNFQLNDSIGKTTLDFYLLIKSNLSIPA